MAVSVVLVLAFILGFSKESLHATVNQLMAEKPAEEQEELPEVEAPAPEEIEGQAPSSANPYADLMKRMENQNNSGTPPKQTFTRPQDMNNQLPFGGAFSSSNSSVRQEDLIKKNKYFRQLSEQMKVLKERNEAAKQAAEEAQLKQSAPIPEPPIPPVANRTEEPILPPDDPMLELDDEREGMGELPEEDIRQLADALAEELGEDF